MPELYSDLSWLPQPPADFNALCRAALNEPDNLGTRIRALASSGLDENQLLRLSKLIGKARATNHSLAPLTPYRLGLISNDSGFPCAGAGCDGCPARDCARMYNRSYDQAMQESLDPNSVINRPAPHRRSNRIRLEGPPHSL